MANCASVNAWRPACEAIVYQVTNNYLATALQTVFSEPTNYYTPGNGSLSVYKNGLRLVLGVDYTETNQRTFTLTVGAALDDVIDAVAYGGTPAEPAPTQAVYDIQPDSAALTALYGQAAHMWVVKHTAVAGTTITLAAGVEPYGQVVNIIKGTGSGDITYVGAAGVTATPPAGGNLVQDTDESWLTAVCVSATEWRLLV